MAYEFEGVRCDTLRELEELKKKLGPRCGCWIEGSQGRWPCVRHRGHDGPCSGN